MNIQNIFSNAVRGGCSEVLIERDSDGCFIHFIGGSEAHGEFTPKSYVAFLRQIDFPLLQDMECQGWDIDANKNRLRMFWSAEVAQQNAVAA